MLRCYGDIHDGNNEVNEVLRALWKRWDPADKRSFRMQKEDGTVLLRKCDNRGTVGRKEWHGLLMFSSV